MGDGGMTMFHQRYETTNSHEILIRAGPGFLNQLLEDSLDVRFYPASSMAGEPQIDGEPLRQGSTRTTVRPYVVYKALSVLRQINPLYGCLPPHLDLRCPRPSRCRLLLRRRNAVVDDDQQSLTQATMYGSYNTPAITPIHCLENNNNT